MPIKFWLVRTKRDRASRVLELYVGSAPPLIYDDHRDTRGRCECLGLIDPAVCCGFSVEPGQCVRAEIGLMQRVGGDSQ